MKSSYGVQRKNFNEDRLILSAAKCRPMSLVSKKYKVYADIHVHSLRIGCQRTFRTMILMMTLFLSVCSVLGSSRISLQAVTNAQLYSGDCSIVSSHWWIQAWGVTLNNTSDYRTNGLYWTPNPNPSPLAR